MTAPVARADGDETWGELRVRYPHGQFADELLRPFLLVTVTVVTIVQLTERPPHALALTIAVFAPVAAVALSTMLSWNRLTPRRQIALAALYAALAAVLLALAPDTAAPAYAYLASAVAGERLRSRAAAFAVAFGGALTCLLAIRIASETDLTRDGWTWWLALSVAAPVFLGVARRDRLQALANARRAADEATRASRSEAREAALEERGRIAREIHDVLGHALSAIALQLDMADALHAKGRDEEANEAVRRARSLAVGSITETRRAVHALSEDTLPLEHRLRGLAAESGAVAFELVGEPGPIAVASAAAVVRTAQEALTNALRHAPGTARTITLAFGADRVTLRVRNGPSDPAADAARSGTAAGPGLGLTGMRERAALLGGTLQAGPDDAGGWLVELEVPR